MREHLLKPNPFLQTTWHTPIIKGGVAYIWYNGLDQLQLSLFVWGKYLYEEYNVLVIILVSGKDPQGNIFKSVLTHT